MRSISRYIRSNDVSDGEIQRYAPSVFATSPSTKQSSRYAFIPTIQIVEQMRRANWKITMASESKTRDEQRKGHVKHMLRFQSRDTRMTTVGDSQLEVVLINSSDGSSVYSLQAGVFRLICENGAVVADSLLEAIKVRHSGNIIDMVLEGSHRILENAPVVGETIERWKQISLTNGEQFALAKSVHVARFPEGSMITPEQLVRANRREDTGGDLWSTFNRLQENAVKGGARAYDPNADSGRGRMVRAREVKNISGNVNLNKAIWTLAEEMAKLKQAA